MASIQRGKKGGKGPRPKSDEVNAVSPHFRTPAAVKFDGHEVAKIQLWLDRMIAQYQFKMEEMAMGPVSKPVKKWRDGQVRYWRHCIKFMKWQLHTIGRHCGGAADYGEDAVPGMDKEPEGNWDHEGPDLNLIGPNE